MNIDALLSPSDDSSSRDDRSLSPSATTSPQRSRPHPIARTSAGLREELHVGSPNSAVSSTPASTSSPTADVWGQTVRSPRAPASAYHGVPGYHHSLPPPPTSMPAASAPRRNRPGRPAHTASRPSVTRPTSTPQMETLADLAASRHREASNRTYSADNVRTVDGLRSRASSIALAPPVARHPSVVRFSATQPSVDFIMAEASSSTPGPPAVASTALSQDQSKEVHDLLSYLADHSYAYESHVQLLNLLHQGFVLHANPPPDAPDPSPKDPLSYVLLSELRQARTAMDTRFAVGEGLWGDWLSDEIIMAASSEDRIRVTELCQKAVQEEPASVKLWQTYADWISSNYAACHDLEGADQSKWSAEDKAICRELFTREMLVNVYEQAMVAVQWRVDESHVLWNRYAGLLLEDMPAQPSRQDVERLRGLFMQRLQVPHARWDDTKQLFWQVVSKYESRNWEAIMNDVNQMAAAGQKQMSLRETHENNLRRYREAGNREAEAEEFTQYLQWEKKQTTKAKTALAHHLRCALYERALLQFPTANEWWIDYIDFVLSSSPPQTVLPLLERATRHCPWSGDLWGRRILRSDVEGKPREEIEATKHRATNSGLLDVGGMEELLKVLQQWCSYLRRYAFRRSSAEDDRDVAELGITAALDDIEQAGLKLYGKEFKGDPLYRLEKIQIKFLAEARRITDAREIYRALVPVQKDVYDFWRNYYTWELWLWGYERLAEPLRVETAANGPHLASAVLQEALSQRNLDWPEKVLDMYLNHFQQHESGEKLQAALVDAREFSKHLAIRRAKEAEEAALAAAQLQAHAVAAANTDSAHDSATPASEKRKREDEDLTNGHGTKKIKTTDGGPHRGETGEASTSASAQIKRDREHNTITVKDLPGDVTELDVKKFFRDVGVPLSININHDGAGDWATATVEFETHEDVLTAKTRSGKMLNGHEVRIQSGTQSTLYVANYPPEFDEESIRKLFESYGEVISVRFPSLKFNSRRRFCYVQFLTAEIAKEAASAMDSKMLDGQHRLSAKISDPDAKKQRSGALEEGRELFVKNVDRAVPDHEVTEFFEQYGSVVSANAVKLVSGKRTGTVFVVFASADEATAALQANNKPFHGRILHVELATPRARPAPFDRARKEDIIIKQPTSASPEPADTNGRRKDSDTSMASAAAAAITTTDDSWKTARERKVAIFHLPDPVNDARVRAALEPYGALLKIQMRRADHGAIVEFASVQDAFNVRQGVDVAALGPDVATGDVADLLARARKRQGKNAAAEAVHGEGAGEGERPRTTGGLLPPVRINRPVAPRGGAAGARHGGGLGLRRGGALGLGKSSATESGEASAGSDAAAGTVTAKSNSDFRALFDKSRADNAPASEEGKA